VIRGGSWNNNARNVRAANRNANQPDNRNNNLGFRCLSSRGREYAFLNRLSSSPPFVGGEVKMAAGVRQVETAVFA
jgi:hypothetical protein